MCTHRVSQLFEHLAMCQSRGFALKIGCPQRATEQQMCTRRVSHLFEHISMCRCRGFALWRHVRPPRELSCDTGEEAPTLGHTILSAVACNCRVMVQTSGFCRQLASRTLVVHQENHPECHARSLFSSRCPAGVYFRLEWSWHTLCLLYSFNFI